MSLFLKGCDVVTPQGLRTRAGVLIDHGLIVAVGYDGPAQETLPLEGMTILPGFIDLHIHGALGCSFLSSDLLEIKRLLTRLPAFGVLGIVATLESAPPQAIEKALDVLWRIRQDPVPEATALLGVHLEGPYLNPLRNGAMDPQHLRHPDPDEMRYLCGRYPGLIRRVTLAPELPGSQALIELLAGLGVQVSIGHTEADYDQARRALSWGATSATHTFNAMRGLHHREPGVVGAVFDSPDTFIAEIIADGIHVHPAMVKSLYRLKGRDALALISDGVAFLGLPDGTSRQAGQQVKVAHGKAVLSDGTICGSVCPLPHAVAWLQSSVGLSLPEIARMSASTPARLLGLDTHLGSLEPGKSADLFALDRDGNIRLTLTKGIKVYTRS